MFSSKRGFIVALAMMGLASVASAAPISYFEAISGDLNDTAPPIFTLDIGLNTVNGAYGPSGDFDAISFVVPAGLQVQQGKVTLTDGIGNATAAAWRLGSGSTTPGSGALVGNMSSSSPGFADMPGAPLGPGNYNLQQLSYSGDTFAATGNYTFIFDVHEIPLIPEPASFAMIGAIGLMSLRRRRIV